MAEPKDTTSFFRKVVKFVANPGTEWAELIPPTGEARENEHAKTELKAMIERKRRNDFVRKSELDMLRKVRREGLSSEQLAALGGSSRLDDSEMRLSDLGARQDSGVKAKIDEIEQQMVGDGYGNAARRAPDFYNAPTRPAAIEMRRATDRPATGSGPLDEFPSTSPPMSSAARGASSAPVPLPANDQRTSLVDLGTLAAPDGEAGHDPELDEAVIAFANADFDQCEQSLVGLVGVGSSRALHAETWLALFDLYRAIGQQQRFEGLALDYAQQFGRSAPQWFSMPRMVAEAAGDERTQRSRIDGQVGWVCPEHIDPDAVKRLSSLSLQMPLPWVFDWSALKGIDVEGCARLSELFRHWIGQKLDMRWLGGEKLFALLQETAPTGVRDADPAYWLLRLDALRMTNRPDQFDEAAIDYCVTYEVSPPSWERALCQVRVSGADQSTQAPSMSVVSELSTSFMESRLIDEPGLVQVASVELSGQLVGDIGEQLRKIDAQLGLSSVVNVSCTRLIRVDFIAAGDLLNWVLSRRTENRSVNFVEAHRLVALFFGAMGINEHASVKVRTL